MIIYIAVITILIFARIKYAGKNQFHQDYLTKENTQAVKGIFILLIFASHFSQYVTFTSPLSTPYVALKQDLGQMVVVPFLFYSGYGVATSVQKKGYSYVRGIPVKRFLSVLFQFDVAILLFYLVQIIQGNPIGIRKFLLSLIAWDSLGNSNWYIFAILSMYLISFLVCFCLSVNRTFKQNRTSAWMITILSLCLIWALKRHRPGYCYNTILAYSAGYLFRQYEKTIEAFCFRWDRAYFLVAGTLFVLFYIWRKSWVGNLAAYELAAAAFGLLIVFFTAKLRINSRVLQYCGEHLFSLFILQRLPMLILSKTPISGNVPVYFVLSLVFTFPLSWIFDQTVPKAWKVIEKRLLRA